MWCLGGFCVGPGALRRSLCVGARRSAAVSLCWGPVLCVGICVGPRRSLSQSVSGPGGLAVSVSVSGPGAVSVRLRRSLCRRPALFVSGPGALCRAPALFVLGPDALCVGPAPCVGALCLCVVPHPAPDPRGTQLRRACAMRTGSPNSPIQSNPQRARSNLRASGPHPTPWAQLRSACHPSNFDRIVSGFMDRPSSSDGATQLRSACHLLWWLDFSCGSGPRATHPALRAPSSDAARAPRPQLESGATHPARRVPFFQERTPNLTVWGKI